MEIVRQKDCGETFGQSVAYVFSCLQENYLNHRPAMAGFDEKLRMNLVAKAADAFSMGDLVNRAVRQYQSWSLMPFAATVGSVLPAAYMRGGRESFYGEGNFPRYIIDLIIV